MEQSQSVIITSEPDPVINSPVPDKPQKAENRRVMRHARTRNTAFQRMCQRKDWASPVY